MTQETITQKMEAANSVDTLAAAIYAGIDVIVKSLAEKGVFVDNGIAVIPYEETTEENRAEVEAWEVDFLTRATMVAYQTWINEKSFQYKSK
jgi:hypothetical protein